MAESEQTEPRAPRFSSAVFSTFGTQLLIAVLSFVNVLIIARALGPAARGDVALLTTISVLASTLAVLGIDEANVNIAGRHPAVRRALATNTVVLALILGGCTVGVLVVLFAAVPAVGGETDVSLRWVALALIPLLILKLGLKFLLQADFRFGAANLAWLLPPLLTVVVNGVLAALDRLSAASAFTTWAAAHGIATIMLVLVVGTRTVGFGRPDRALAGRALNFGYKSHVGRVMMAGNYRADQWFVGAMAGSRELGLYSIAVAWSEILLYLPTVLAIVQRPYLVRADPAAAARRSARVFRMSVIVTAAATAAVVLLAPLLCTTVFGDAFAGSVDDLRVLALGAMGILTMKLLGNAITAQGRPELATAGAAAAFAVTLALDIALIPGLGGLGAAIASAAAYLVGGIATAVLFVRFFRTGWSTLTPRPQDAVLLAEIAGRGVPTRVRAGRRNA